MDYGPFGFVDSYDGGFVANCSDGEGRYALAKQPDVRFCYFFYINVLLIKLIGCRFNENTFLRCRWSYGILVS